MYELLSVALLASLMVLYIWMLSKQHPSSQQLHAASGFYWLEGGFVDPRDHGSKDAMPAICLRCGYSSAAEFLAGAKRVFEQLSTASEATAQNGDDALASRAAMEGIRSSRELYRAGAIENRAAITCSSLTGDLATIQVRFGMPGTSSESWHEPRSWDDAKRRLTAASQMWIFERDVRSQHPGWYLVRVDVARRP